MHVRANSGGFKKGRKRSEIKLNGTQTMLHSVETVQGKLDQVYFSLFFHLINFQPCRKFVLKKKQND